MIQFLDQAAQNAYSDLHVACLEPAFDGSGVSFTKKIVKGKSYVYVNAKVGRIPVQRYLGPDTLETAELIQREITLWDGGQQSRLSRSNLVRMLSAGGAFVPPPQEGKVLRMLERGGIFLSGGTLIGTPAFNAIGNMLGVRWLQQFATRDVDIAASVRLPVAVVPKKISMKELLVNSNMGFLEVPTLNRKHPSTSFKIKGGDFRVELFTPETGKPDKTPVYIPHLNAQAEPLRFLDYLLKETQSAVVLFDIGLLVNVPDPAHFAIHKLAISQKRAAAFAIKIKKDIAQATQLIDVLLDTQPGSLFVAHEAAREFHGKFFKLYQNAVTLLPESVQQKLNNVIADYSNDK